MRKGKVNLIPKMLEDFQNLSLQKSAKGLIKLALWAEKAHIKGPKNMSKDLDKYLWE